MGRAPRQTWTCWAKRDLAGLRKACGVDEEDLKEMIAELQGADAPGPAQRSAANPSAPVVPDVYVREGMGGLWHVELNSENPAPPAGRSPLSRPASSGGNANRSGKRPSFRNAWRKPTG